MDFVPPIHPPSPCLSASHIHSSIRRIWIKRLYGLERGRKGSLTLKSKLMICFWTEEAQRLYLTVMFKWRESEVLCRTLHTQQGLPNWSLQYHDFVCDFTVGNGTKDNFTLKLDDLIVVVFIPDDMIWACVWACVCNDSGYRPESSAPLWESMGLNSEGFLRGISSACQYCSVSQVHFQHTHTLPGHCPKPGPPLPLLFSTNPSVHLPLSRSSIKLAPLSPLFIPHAFI